MGCPELSVCDYFRFVGEDETVSERTDAVEPETPYWRIFCGGFFPIEEKGGLNQYAYANGDPINGIEYLGCADLPNHLNIGFDVLDILGIRLNRQELECFLSGCIYPDMPDVPFVADNGVIPKAMPLHIYLQTKEGYEYYKNKYQDQIKRVSDVVSMIGDIDELLIPQIVKKPFQYAGEKLAVQGKRFGYWWNQTSYIGPVLRYTPVLKNFDTVRTHYGDMAYYHAMGYKGNSAVELRQNLIGITNERVNEFGRYISIGNTHDAYFALGQAVHYLTDSWTPSHALRNPTGQIEMFQDYSIQDLNIHKTRDALYQYDPASYNNAVTNSSLLIFEALIGSGTFDSSWYYQTAPKTTIDIPLNMEQKPLWNIMFNGY